MGVKLDWEIEAEEELYQNVGETRQDIRQRWANRRQALLAVLLVAGAILAVVGVVMARYWYVEATIEQQLRDTVAAEVTALRLGDIAAYLYTQRSESDAWVLSRSDLFWRYQQMKLEHEIQLTGEVLAIEIDNSRARVLVEEIIDGRSYQVLWFYWRYEDGWRHVPMDSTFWGESVTVEGVGFMLDYHELDVPVADALLPMVERLWGQGCAWLGCADAPPPITIRIIPDATVGVSWSPDAADTLRIASPLTGRASVETPLEPAQAAQIGALLAARLLDHAQGGIQPVAYTDADFLRGALEDWLVGRFLGDGSTGSTFVESLVAAYGERAATVLNRAITPEATIAAVGQAFATPTDALPVDWREFFQWRLALEPFFLGQGELDRLRGLYDDLGQPEVNALINDPGAASRPTPTVLRVVLGAGTDGSSRAWADVQYADGSVGPIAFRLVDGVWRRSTPDAAYATYAGD